MPDEILNGEKQEVKEVQEAIPTSETPADSSIETDGQLPEGVSERTKEQFEKLKEHNRQLAEQLKQQNAQPKISALDSLMPQQDFSQFVPQWATQQEVEDVIKDIVDSEGYVDTALLKNKLEESKNIAKQAAIAAQEAINEAKQIKAQFSKMNQDQIVSKTHSSFPEVDPNSDKFNPVLYELVKNEMIGQMMQGKQDFYGATQKWVTTLNASKPQVDTQTSAKEHINTGGQSKPEQNIEHDRLTQGAAAGDVNALGQLLKNSGY